MNLLRFTALAILTLVGLSSCFDIRTDVELRSDGSVELEAVYEIAREVWELGAFDDDNPNRVFPVSRRDIEELADLNDGVSLVRYRLRETATQVTIEFRLEIDDPQAFAQLWSGFSDRAAMTDFSPADRSLRLPLTSMREGIDPDAADLIRDELRGARYRLNLTTPGSISEVLQPEDGLHLLPDGGPGERNIAVEAKIADFVLDPSPYVLELRWE